MPGLQILIHLISMALVALAGPTGGARKIRATGRVAVIAGQAWLIVDEGSISETRLRLRANAAAAKSPLFTLIASSIGRVVTVEGTAPDVPKLQRGELFTDARHLRWAVPDPLAVDRGHARNLEVR